MRNFAVAAISLCACAWVAGAAADTIDFEGFAAGTIIDTEYAGLGVTFSAINIGGGPDVAVIFDTDNPTGGDEDLGAPFSNDELGIAMPGNVLILQENDTCDAFICANPDDEGSRPAGTFIIEFEIPALIESIDFFDIESEESGALISLFGENGLLDTFLTPDTGGDNTWMRLAMNVENITRIELELGGSGAISNIEFTPVPLPAGLVLMLSALGGLGILRRRRC